MGGMGEAKSARWPLGWFWQEGDAFGIGYAYSEEVSVCPCGPGERLVV
jgi:hypothetical protein